jgi:hypothetical protein
MSRLRSLAGQSPAIVISIIALACSLSGGAYAATQLHATQTASTATVRSQIPHHSTSPAWEEDADFDWHNLTLINGWITLPDNLGFGPPAFAIRDGIVYFRGALQQRSPATPIFAILHTNLRLTHTLRIAISVAPDPGQGIGGTLRITPIGHHRWRLEAIGPQAPFFASLAGASFPLTS